MPNGPADDGGDDDADDGDGVSGGSGDRNGNQRFSSPVTSLSQYSITTGVLVMGRGVDLILSSRRLKAVIFISASACSSSGMACNSS